MAPRTTASLVFVHLSDIHFHYKWSGTSYDFDLDIRKELENSLRELARNFPRVDGILVSGDIAFSGQAQEYQMATDWLGTLAGIVNCPSTNISVIPGNHDIDRGVLKENDYIYDWHSDIRSEPEKADAKLRLYMTTKLKAQALFEPLSKYQEFAKQYGCFTSPTEPFWEKDVTFHPQVKLRIRGINSALLCSDKDGNQPTNQLIIGSKQATHSREDGVVYLTMCHHPPGWLVDEINVDQLMLAPNRVPIQLFGHEHRYHLQECEHSLRLYAGAVHPDRTPSDWVPRYNILRISVEEGSDNSFLRVEVWPQRWHEQNQRFELDNDNCGETGNYSWLTPIQGFATRFEPIDATPSQIVHSANQEETKPTATTITDAIQELVSRYMRLPYHQRVVIASELALINDDDEQLDSNDQYRRYINRARDREAGFRDLWAAVAKFDSELAGRENPFS